ARRDHPASRAEQRQARDRGHRRRRRPGHSRRRPGDAGRLLHVGRARPGPAGDAAADGWFRDHLRLRQGDAGYRPTMETLIKPPIEWAVAELAREGQSESGDRYLTLTTADGGLVAVVDGLGHGAEAASAAKTAVRALERGAHRPLVQLLRDCHQSLVGTRGAVVSAAAFTWRTETMTWLGVGNVEGVLLRAPASRGARPQSLLV